MLEHFHAVEPSARLSDERDRARDAKNGATTWFVQSGIGETEELKRARAEYDRARASEASGDTTAARFSYGEALVENLSPNGLRDAAAHSTGRRPNTVCVAELIPSHPLSGALVPAGLSRERQVATQPCEGV